MARSSALLVLLLVSAPVRAFAQGTLTLDQAVAGALAQNRSLAAARSSIQQAGAQVTDARAGLFPRITVSESWQRGDEPVFVFSSLLSSRRFAAANFAIDALNHPDPVGFFRTSIGVEQMLYDGGRTRSGVDTASIGREIASLRTEEAAMEVAFSVVDTFGRALSAQAARRASDAGVESAREDLLRAERRRDAGMATEADVLSLRVHLADLQQRAIQASGDTAVARAELNHLMGAPIDRDYEVVEPVLLPIGEASPDDLPVRATDALASHPTMKRSDAETRLADAVRSQARAGFIPQVAVQSAFDLSGTTIGDRASSWIVGGELRWTLSTGGAEQARLRAAAEAASRARIEREDARARIEVEVVSAVRRLEAARAREAIGAAAVEEARESQRIIRDRFEAGLAGTDQLLRASTSVLEADARRTAALVDRIVSQAMVDKASGRVPTLRGSS